MSDQLTSQEPVASAALTLLNDRVREQMSRMPSRDVKPELARRRELHCRGLRFRTNYREVSSVGL